MNAPVHTVRLPYCLLCERHNAEVEVHPPTRTVFHFMCGGRFVWHQGVTLLALAKSYTPASA